jgi:hypothetical protein
MGAILDEQGINSNQVINPNQTFTSGFDRLLSSADVQDIIEDNQGFYTKIEDRVYQIVKAIHKNFIKRDLFKSQTLLVSFKKPKVLVSDSEKLQNIKTMDELNVLYPWEKYMLIDPNMSEEEAKAKYDEIRKLKMSAISEFGNNLQEENNNEEEDKEEVEDEG